MNDSLSAYKKQQLQRPVLNLNGKTHNMFPTAGVALQKKCAHQVYQERHWLPHTLLSTNLLKCERSLFFSIRFSLPMAEETPCKVQNRRNLEEQQKYFRSCQPWRDSADNSLTNRTHQPRTTFFMHSCCTDLFLFIVRVYSNTMTSMHLHGSRLKCIFASHFKTFHLRCAMSYTLLYMTPRTGTLSSPFPEPVFQHSEQTQQRGALTETPLFTGYEPNRIAEDRDYGHFTGYGQFIELEDLRVRPLSFHQSIVASNYDSAESIATSQNRTLMANNFVHCWLHHCTNKSEEQVQNDRKFITLNEHTGCPVHLKIQQVQGNLSHCFEAQIGWIKTHFPKETKFFADINRFWE